MLYWPPDGQCYKIYQVGYPCPDGMELVPSPISTNVTAKQIAAECRCPPQTAQFPDDGRCYKLFTAGPCERGQFFSPDDTIAQNSRRWGKCKIIEKCENSNELYWPEDKKCYLHLTQGPCSKGQLITTGSDNVSACKCDHEYEMQNYWSHGNGCYEHYTKGPCRENGHLFLPNQRCGCHNLLPHYHNSTNMCYELGTLGPCSIGEQFLLDQNIKTATCQCKKGHIRYENNLNCYRPYTQGPCPAGHILIDATSCIKQPCSKGYLYFPVNKSCYRIGNRGPCKKNHVISFDFHTRPSIDGISYNAVCRCKHTSNHICEQTQQAACDRDHNTVIYNDQCFKLYSQTPCPTGAWLVAKRQSKEWETKRNEGLCQCMPGYKQNAVNGSDVECAGPAIALAEFLNQNSKKHQNMYLFK
ncbi:uncharacterized protein LOC116167873 isoform X2 [Photinus pyralis]|nr:uncharacterized protein LOC116167873 isoform X2 [Photinus pyralis]XP_031339327.1 uncharacterized protein LOC116167873 isoform X2 [Photinus pyralis]XP_031339328.1 uncharacterized protein LOC116167873 isoform X2 [Photinus pyralis]